MTTEPVPPRLLLGIGISLVAYLFFVTVSSTVWSLQGRFPTVQIIFIQNLVSWLCILPIALRNGIKPLKTKFFSDHILRDLFGVSSYFLYFLAIRDLNLVDATTLNYSAPFFVPLIWWIWMKQKVGAHVWWSIIVGFIGVAVRERRRLYRSQPRGSAARLRRAVPDERQLHASRLAVSCHHVRRLRRALPRV